jgi:hypothetical protein
MLGGIKWPILYHQALIQKSNAKIKAEFEPKCLNSCLYQI